MRFKGKFLAFLSLSMIYICACKTGTQASTPQTTINTPQGANRLRHSGRGYHPAGSHGRAAAWRSDPVWREAADRPSLPVPRHQLRRSFLFGDKPPCREQESGGPGDRCSNRSKSGGGSVAQRRRLALRQDRESHDPATVQHLASRCCGSSFRPGSWRKSGLGSSAAYGNSAGSHGQRWHSRGMRGRPPERRRNHTPFGTHGEVVILNNMYLAQDPYAQSYRNMQRMGIQPLRGMIVYPANANLVKALPAILQQIRRSNGLAPAPLQIDHAEQAPAPQGSHCVQATGQMNLRGRACRLCSGCCVQRPLKSMAITVSMTMEHFPLIPMPAR